MDLETLHGYGSTPNSEVLEQIVNNYVVSADGNLNAGDLCEFINGQVRKTWLGNTAFSSIQVSTTPALFITALVLDTNRVFVSYAYNSSACIYGVILTISNKTTLSKGTIVQLTSTYGISLSSVLVNFNRIVLFYENTSNNNYMWGIVIDINDTTINVTNTMQLTNVAVSNIVTTLITGTSILVNYANTNSYLYSMMVDISGNNLITNTLLQVTTTLTQEIKCIKINNNKVLLVYTGTSNYPYGVILTINGDTLSVGSGISLTGISTSFITVNLLNPTTFLLCYINGTSASSVSSFLFTINDNAITKNSGFVAVLNSTYMIRSLTLDTNRVLLVYSDSSTYYMYAKVITVKDGVVTVGLAYQLNSLNSSSGFVLNKLDDKYVLIHYISSSTAYTLIIGINDTIISSHALSPDLLCLASALSGDTTRFMLKGIAKGLTNLIPSVTYYCSTEGDLNTAQLGNKIGVALSNTELLISNGMWERK